MAKSTFFFICLISLAVFIPAAFGAEGTPPPLTLDNHLSAAKEHKASIKDNDSINAKIFTPAISGNAAFSTFDGQTSFKANLVCSSDAPVVRVTAFPVGNLGAIGELNLRIEYDVNLDGQLEGQVTINNVGGMCGNGFVRDCAPSGSWKNCRFCKWTMENGVVKEKCDYGTTTQAAPIGPQGMTGCFCFNASCGSPVLSMLETTLSFAAKGVLDVLREYNNTLVITRSEFSPESMQLSYMGAKISNCEEAGNDATIAGLTGLVGKFEFPAGEALAKAEADPNHPYNAAMASFGQDNATFKKCVMQARVGVETRTVERSSLLDFGIGVDADGGSKQCYWFRHGYCGQVFGETKYLDVCISRIIPAALSDLCNQFLVNAGVFDQFTGISAYRATSGVANYIGCYGSENDRADQLWEVRCHGTRKEDVFVCKSPSMSLPGQLLKNEPYSPSLFQGCDEVLEPESSCAPLEEQRKNGECMLYSEVVDGVYTLREGSLTGLTAAQSCKNTAGRSKSLTVCEPWWKKERVYRCTGQDPDFAKAKERAKYIGGTIGFDKDTNTWSGQGDLTWDAAGNQVKNVFDPAVEFQPNGKTCIPGCRVQTSAKVTDLFIPSQGKLASDGSYHMDSQGELSYTLNRDSVIRTARECEEKASGVYECPLQPGETPVSGCECFDTGAFGEVVSTLAAINLASSNMICSTGNNVGVCSPEDMENGKNAERVMCGEFKKNADGSVTPVGDGMTDCLPKLWKGTTAANQTHHVTVTSDYRCHVAAPALPEDDHFDNDLGSLIPQPAWFDAVAADAGLWIKEALKSDSAFIPDPEAGCACASGASCSWVSLSDENTITREDALLVNPGHPQPFGAVFLSLVQNRYWQGVKDGKSFQCGLHTRSLRFRLTLQKTGTGFTVELSQERPVQRHLRSRPFTQTELFTRQCVERYTSPYADFTDPATRLVFKATYLDLLAYQVAAFREELPRDEHTWSLPALPLTFRPTYSLGEVEKSVLPNIPMFWDAQVSAAYDAGSGLGRAMLSVSSLVPYVYYYQCPLSTPVKSAANSCGAVDPFGGVDQTISGPHCFKHRCDANALLEPVKPVTGCGMVNDADWQ